MGIISTLKLISPSEYLHQRLKSLRQPFFSLGSLQIFTERLHTIRIKTEPEKSNNNYMEIVFFSFELGRGVDFRGANFLYGHLHIVHPLHHLAVPGVVHLPDEGVVLLPERHVAVTRL